MTKSDKEFIDQIEEAVEYLKNTTFVCPLPSAKSRKSTKEFVEKLIKKYEE
jgi:hypothetical protein